MGKIDNWAFDEISFRHVCLFRMIGILPYSIDAKQSNFRILMRNYISKIYFNIANAMYSSMHLVYGLRMALHNILDIELICELVIVQGVCLRYLMLYWQRKRLMSLVKLCEELWSFLKTDEGKTVRDFERMVYYLRNLFLWNTFVAATFYLLTAQFIRVPSPYVNGTMMRVLPFKFYVDVHDGFWYVAVTILQGVLAYSEAVIVTGIETIGPFLIMMACGYLRVIRYRFKAMTNIPNDNGMNKNYTNNMEKLPVDEILRCVQFHQKIMEFCHQIEYLMRSLFMIQVSCTIYNISLIAITVLEGNKKILKYVSILILNLAQFFTCQWIPQYLLNESEAIATAAYTAALTHPIYEREANRMLLFTVLRADKPVQLTAGGYINLSLETFERMCISAISFFTVLRSFSD